MPAPAQTIAVDNIQARAAANGTVPFILEEPIVPTQEMVPTGPRRCVPTYLTRHSMHDYQAQWWKLMAHCSLDCHFLLHLPFPHIS